MWLSGTDTASLRTEGSGDSLDGCVKWRLMKCEDLSKDSSWDVLVFYITNVDICLSESHSHSRVRYGMKELPSYILFKYCRFSRQDDWRGGISFESDFYDSNIRECFTFDNNTGACNFALPDNSEVVFRYNDCSNISVGRSTTQSPGHNSGLILLFEDNEISKLIFDFWMPSQFFLNFRFIGNNKIGTFRWNGLISRRSDHVKYDDLSEYSLFYIHFDQNTRIDANFSNNGSLEEYKSDLIGMREIFVKLASIANVRRDSKQENILTAYKAPVDYAQVKNSKWYKSTHGWQDWLILTWRYVSSDFYRSWLRPVSLFVGGYMILNLIPFLFIGFDGYWEFCFYRPTRIFSYPD